MNIMYEILKIKTNVKITNVLLASVMLFQLFPQRVSAQNTECSEAYLRSIGATVLSCEEYNRNNCSPYTLSFSGSGQTTLPDSVPEPWRSLINNAAQDHPTVDPRLVAAVLLAEHNASWPEYREGGYAVSGSGAAGAFQFIPSTWELFDRDNDGDGFSDIDGDRDGVADPDNPVDAVQAAFLHHPNSAGQPIANGLSGDIYDDFETVVLEEDSLLHFMGRYNGGSFSNNWLGQSLSSWGNRPSNIDDRAQNQNYIIAAYWAIASNFTLAWDYASFELIEPRGADGSSGALTSVNCLSSGGGAAGITLDDIVYYGQCDPRWSNDSYGNSSMCASGCGPTSMAMIFSTLLGRNIDPLEVAERNLAGGHRTPNDGTAWSAFTEVTREYNLAVEDIGRNENRLIDGLRRGGLVIASVGPGHFTNGGHIIVIRGVTDDGRYLVADPNDGPEGSENYLRKSNTEWDSRIIMSETRNFWVITNE